MQVACNTHVHLQMDEEFNQLLNGFAPVQHEEPALTFQASAAQKTPAEVDWRMRGYVTASCAVQPNPAHEKKIQVRRLSPLLHFGVQSV